MLPRLSRGLMAALLTALGVGGVAGLFGFGMAFFEGIKPSPFNFMVPTGGPYDPLHALRVALLFFLVFGSLWGGLAGVAVGLIVAIFFPPRTRAKRPLPPSTGIRTPPSPSTGIHTPPSPPDVFP